MCVCVYIYICIMYPNKVGNKYAPGGVQQSGVWGNSSKLNSSNYIAFEKYRMGF